MIHAVECFVLKEVTIFKFLEFSAYNTCKVFVVIHLIRAGGA